MALGGISGSGRDAVAGAAAKQQEEQGKQKDFVHKPPPP
jgi:hypothetical protein